MNELERLQAKIDNIRQLTTTDAESKEAFIRRVRAVLDSDKCRHCGGAMRPDGEALEDILNGIPDFPGDKQGVTVSPSGKAKLVECSKCEKCGWSVNK